MYQCMCVRVCMHMIQCIIFGAFTVLMIRIESCQDTGFSIRNLITLPLIILTDKFGLTSQLLKSAYDWPFIISTDLL